MDGMALNVVSADWSSDRPPRSGQIAVRFETYAEFKAAIARLSSGVTAFDGGGVPRIISLAKDGFEDPAGFPCVVHLRVAEKPTSSPERLMDIASNWLQSRSIIHVLELVEPEGDRPTGLLKVACASLNEYLDLRRFVDEPHGSALMARDGSGRSMHIRRIGDDGEEDSPFPQSVSIEFEVVPMSPVEVG